MSLFPDLNPFSTKNIPSFEYKVEQDPETQAWQFQIHQSSLLYVPHLFTSEESNGLLDYLLRLRQGKWQNINWEEEAAEELAWVNIPWKRDRIKMFGKVHQIPRLSAWHGDPGAAYSYSGIVLDPHPWNEALLQIRTAIGNYVDQYFNSVLLNCYRDGNDHMSWHSDDEKELGQNPVIASVNLGASRRFLLRNKTRKDQKIEVLLEHGSLLVMQGDCQHRWQHSVPKQKKAAKNRVNLTFRSIRAF